MQVIVNLQPLLKQLTGVGHYTRELTRELVARHERGDQPDQIQGLVGLNIAPLSHIDPLLVETSPDRSSAKPDAGSKAWQFARRYLRNPITRFAYQQALSQRLRAYALRSAGARDTVYWEPNYIRLPWPGKSVVTVHDLSHHRFPQYHPKERVNFFKRHLSSSLKAATRINVVSQFTSQELQTIYGIAPERIDVVPPGVAERFFDITPQPCTQLQERYRLPARYCLSVGTLEPRKNLGNLLKAFLSLSPERQHECPLVLVGMRGWGEQSLSENTRQALADGRIRRLGYVADHDLPALYANATLFAYVSRYEGFGMPVIEAMAAGVPVVTADRTATLEVAGDAALCVDPEDIDAIRHALERLQDDERLHASLCQAGRQRATHFTWNRSADALLASIRHALSH